ncbi:hypothetical protein GRX03_00780 [Halovenus sp. WSH3]|uniref:Uncharacterized protein n=1 Tax=Halovenus carboxidivorans TaxID=2692199 RepID=A0A6B0SXS2_9EURY|nr:DUF5791 family protein [Halovenus carboxidivorans]MXR50145.1 hypothetical protein [Halovenus carboxidivorans]
MLRGRFEAAGDLSPGELRSEYEAALVETIESVGAAAVADRTGLDEATIRALVDGESPELTLEEAAAILGTDDQYPDADAIEAEARDILLMGMSIAVLDVEAIAAGINDRLEPKEIQQKVEGRYPITLEEYAIIHSYIEREKR